VAGVERAGHRLGLALVGVRQQRQGLERNACWQQVKDLPILEKLRLSSQQGEAFAALQEWHQRLILTELLIEAALFRQESRGGHFRTDAPAPQPFWQRHSHQIRDRAIGTTPASP
jgi:L-aspartate oxidase